MPIITPGAAERGADLRAEIGIKVNRRGQVESAMLSTGNISEWAKAVRTAAESWIVIPSASAECKLEPYETHIVVAWYAKTEQAVVSYAPGAFEPRSHAALSGLGPQKDDQWAYLDIARSPNWAAVSAFLTVNNASGRVEDVEVLDIELNRGFARNAERNRYRDYAVAHFAMHRFQARAEAGTRRVCLASIVPAGARLNEGERSAAPERR